MNIKSIGGEFALINKISSIFNKSSNNLIKGIGDDAAVIKINNNNLLLVTVDALVENIHFKTTWSSPEQIGKKAVESNISDIAAMGGSPTYMFASLIFPNNFNISWIEKLQKGMKKVCNKYNITLAGGNISKGEKCVISITLLGKVSNKNLCLRSDAKPGDYLAVTGNLGGSFAGLTALSMGQPISKYILKKHLEPKAKLKTSLKINSIVNAMIDISDGLSSEIHHICNDSKTGVEIYEEKLPIHKDVIKIAKYNSKHPYEFVLKGGEDLELLFSFNPKSNKKLNKMKIKYHIIGKIKKEKNKRFFIKKSGGKKKLSKSYDHFL